MVEADQQGQTYKDAMAGIEGICKERYELIYRCQSIVYDSCSNMCPRNECCDVVMLKSQPGKWKRLLRPRVPWAAPSITRRLLHDTTQGVGKSDTNHE